VIPHFLKRFVPFFVMVAFALAGCGEISSSSSDAPAAPLPGNGGDDTVVPPPNTDIIPDTTIVRQVQGELEDIGDLVGSEVNTWWYTKSAAINDDGIIVGQSNTGEIVKGAFSWNPVTDEMTFFGNSWQHL
jgi:hypothetical protein